MSDENGPTSRTLMLAWASAMALIAAALAALGPYVRRVDWDAVPYRDIALIVMFSAAVILLGFTVFWPRPFGERRRTLMGIAASAVALIAATWGLSRVLEQADVLGLGPSDAPAVIAAVTGIPALIAAAIAAGPRFIRAWGARARDTGEGQGAAASGEAGIVRARREGDAAVIRAEKEGEAARIRAEAELLRAKAELKRAEMGLDPLPAPQILPPDQPLMLPPGSTNGNGTTADPAQ
ncbi:hypothetical protein [Streptomyces sp. CL7]|uniref:hypothetical protein n=1 Tax=Streptomyces sp. CL7 TaxID=3096006 RepID=UPI002A75A93A|nr:hypothetical protein [Streptomyces sp. CL7]WPP32259.1 hypothetical protein SJH97_24330 [Streptomyces sp. CL7]